MVSDDEDKAVAPSPPPAFGAFGAFGGGAPAGFGGGFGGGFGFGMPFGAIAPAAAAVAAPKEQDSNAMDDDTDDVPVADMGALRLPAQ